jgi:hypothetical protein
MEEQPVSPRTRYRARAKTDEQTINPDEDVKVQLDEGMYMSVVAAAFGKIKMDIETWSPKIHPFFLLLVALPLFSLQITALITLILSMDLDGGIIVYSGDNAKECDEDHDSDCHIKEMLWVLKLMMIIIVQAMMLEKLLHTIRLVVFLLNPFTWLEVDRSISREWGWLRYAAHPIVCAPCAIFALFLRFVICYFVIVFSVSIILEAKDPKDVLFNSVAILFIFDMSKEYWTFLKTFFYMPQVEELKADPTVWQKDGALVKDKEIQDRMGPLLQRLEDNSYFQVVSKLSPYFRRKSDRVLGARTIEAFLASIVLFFLFTRQLFFTIFAYETNVLPAARDVCTLYRFLEGKATYFDQIGPMIRMLIVPVVNPWFDLKAETKKIIHRLHHGKGVYDDECLPGGTYYRMVSSDKDEIWRIHKSSIIKVYAAMFVALFLPQIVRLMEKIYTKSLLPYLAKEANPPGSPSKVRQQQSTPQESQEASPLLTTKTETAKSEARS